MWTVTPRQLKKIRKKRYTKTNLLKIRFPTEVHVTRKENVTGQTTIEISPKEKKLVKSMTEKVKVLKVN